MDAERGPLDPAETPPVGEITRFSDLTVPCRRGDTLEEAIAGIALRSGRPNHRQGERRRRKPPSFNHPVLVDEDGEPVELEEPEPPVPD